MRLCDRAAGCLLGGAMGDAFGYPVEFMSLKEIKRRNDGSILLEPISNQGRYEFSDDTQMTLLTAAGLAEGGEDQMGSIWRLYGRWAEFQSGVAELSDADHWLFSRRSMRDDRFPGRTCMGAILGNDVPGTIDDPINDSKGCGGVMRVSPVPIWSFAEGKDSIHATRLAARIAASTHGHSLGYVTAGFLSSMIFHILDGEDLHGSLSSAKRDCEGCFDSRKLEDMFRLVERAVGLSGSDSLDQDSIAELGEGWVAEETLAMAVFSCLRHPDDIRGALVCAVNITGDSDSVGAVAGNIMGALLGVGALKSEFDIDRLEDSDMIEKVSDILISKLHGSC